ncbi:MAG: hypothetical protein RL441_1382, partial [Actinomycetota bacterium]
MAPRNLLNLEAVSVDYGKGFVLDGISLGVNLGDRIGIVGRNGGGKTTLMRIMAGTEQPHSGRVSHSNNCHVGVLTQVDSMDPNLTVRQFVLGEQADHEWATLSDVRDVFTGLFGGFDETVMDRRIGPLSGGERRRVALARLLIEPVDVLLLDEPTNHLDVEAVAWLAAYLKAKRNYALVVVTHDRWFLDEVSDRTWEVVDGKVEEYDGGYSAFVLAKAERLRQASAMEARRNNLLRKELAWLRRGAPARTSKPKFRIDAANELIANEPPPRDDTELLAFANARLGKTVCELHDADIELGGKKLLSRVSWNVGPGDRIAIVGMNGAGKTTLMRVLNEQLPLTAGKLVVGSTVKFAFLSQHLEELNPQWRVLEAVEHVARRVELGKGRELSASQLCERLGFGADAQWTPVGDLSGGERRRLQLTRLLMTEPNVLMLDEPTNDFDVETLAALEDLLDSFGGTLLVVSHDRYFLERTCDNFVGLLGDGQIRDLPRGIDQYLEMRKAMSQSAPGATTATVASSAAWETKVSAAEERDIKKELNRLERQITKLQNQRESIHEKMATHATDFEK